MEELVRGTRIAGRYSVVRLLGKGAMKHVYLADDVLTGDSIALALLAPTGMVDGTADARFTREARIGSTLQSPYAVRVHDEGRLRDGTQYLATEAVLGRSLEDALANGAVAPERAARWTVHVLAALADSHRLGIVHRDIKPDNVLLALTADGEMAKLTDFGIAKLLDTSVEQTNTVQTAANVLLGTPQYMSPEQWQSGRIDGRADLYSTGVMLYELLLGTLPFEAYDLQGLCVAHLSEPPRPFPPDASPLIRELEPIVMRALAKDPADRFQSADEMREAIERATGYLLDGLDAGPELLFPTRFARAELVSDAWMSSIQLVLTPNVTLGRDPETQIPVRCLPESEENLARTRMISSQHARIDWRGGRARIADLGSRGGTAVGGRAVASTPTDLTSGDEISIGPHARMLFEHSPTGPGELPKWARLARLDRYGLGQVRIVVLSEATISSGAEAAIQISEKSARGESLRIRVHDSGLAAQTPDSDELYPLHDGQLLRLGDLEILVVIEE